MNYCSIFMVFALLACALIASADDSFSLPDDVPLLHQKGQIDHAETPNCLMFSYPTTATIPNVFSEYIAKLEASGWEAACPPDLDESNEYAYGSWIKGSRRLSLNISEGLDSIEVDIRTCRSDVSCRSDGITTPDPAAGAILDAIKTRYRSLKGYRDSGKQVSQFLDNTGEPSHDSTLSFTLAIQRDGGFRFEYTDEGDNYVIHKGEDGVRAYWTLIDEQEKFPALEDALGQAAGVSGRTSEMIPGLFSGNDTDLGCVREARVLPNVTIDGVECQGIEGFDSECMPVRIWAGANDKLIRRWETSNQFSDFRSTDVTTFTPEADPNFLATELAFEPIVRLKSTRPAMPSFTPTLFGVLGDVVGRIISLF